MAEDMYGESRNMTAHEKAAILLKGNYKWCVLTISICLLNP